MPGFRPPGVELGSPMLARSPWHRGPFGEGTFRVGRDVAPGTWRVTNAGDSCYWERTSGFSGELDDIIANDLPSGTALVTIAATDVGFTSHRCGVWSKVG